MPTLPDGKANTTLPPAPDLVCPTWASLDHSACVPTRLLEEDSGSDDRLLFGHAFHHALRRGAQAVITMSFPLSRRIANIFKMGQCPVHELRPACLAQSTSSQNAAVTRT